MDGKNENGLPAFLKICPTSEGSNFATVCGIIEYLTDMGYAVRGEIIFLNMDNKNIFSNSCLRI